MNVIVQSEGLIVMKDGRITHANTQARQFLSRSPAIRDVVSKVVPNNPCTVEIPKVSVSFYANYVGMTHDVMQINAECVPHLPGYILVHIRPTSDLVQQVEGLLKYKYVIQTLPAGVVLYEWDKRSGGSQAMMVNATTCAMMDVTVEELRERGMKALGERTPLVDRKRIDPVAVDRFLHGGIMEEPFRFMMKGKFEWRHFRMNCQVHGDTTYVTNFFTDYTEAAMRDRHMYNSLASSLILSSFITDLFNVTFNMDQDFNIIDDTPVVRSFLGISAVRRTRHMRSPAVLSQPNLLDFVALDSDREKLKAYIDSRPYLNPNEAVDSESEDRVPQLGSSLTRIHLRLGSGSPPMCECDLFASLTYSDLCGNSDGVLDIDTLGIPTPLNGRIQQRYMVAIRKVPAHMDTSLAPIPELDNAQFNTSSVNSSGIEQTLSDPAQSLVAHEDDPVGSEYSKGGSCCSTVFVFSMYIRVLQRYLLNSLSGTRVSNQSSPLLEIHKKWIVPIYCIDNIIQVREEVLARVPQECRLPIQLSIAERDVEKCVQLLECRVLSMSGRNSDSKCECQSGYLSDAFARTCVMRIVWDVAMSACPEDAHKAYSIASQSFTRLVEDTDPRCRRLMHLEKTLMSLSLALRCEELSKEGGVIINALREDFVASISTTFVDDQEKRVILPVLYWICIIWASALRMTENITMPCDILRETIAKMEEFAACFTSETVRTLLMISYHNLAIDLLDHGDAVGAFKWITALDAVSRDVSPSDRITKCQELLDWASSVQAHRRSMYG